VKTHNDFIPFDTLIYIDLKQRGFNQEPLLLQICSMQHDNGTSSRQLPRAKFYLLRPYSRAQYP